MTHRNERYVDSCHIKYAAGDVSAAIGSAEPVDAGFWAFPTGYTYRFNAQYLYTKEDMVIKPYNLSRSSMATVFLYITQGPLLCHWCHAESVTVQHPPSASSESK